MGREILKTEKESFEVAKFTMIPHLESRWHLQSHWHLQMRWEALVHVFCLLAFALAGRCVHLTHMD